ncbi:MAG: DUF433 domain-containing protein [Planctomycetota bacterium]
MTGFTTTEAHALTGQSAKRIQKLIEREFICCRTEEQGARSRRVLELADMLMVVLLDEYRDLLSEGLRKRVHQHLHEAGDLEQIEQVEVEGVLILRVTGIRERLQQEVGRLEEARRMVVESPKILGGEPVIRGTRIPVRQVAVMANTMSPEEILEGYPSLRREHIELARLYARAYPKQGRPARRG